MEDDAPCQAIVFRLFKEYKELIRESNKGRPREIHNVYTRKYGVTTDQRLMVWEMQVKPGLAMDTIHKILHQHLTLKEECVLVGSLTFLQISTRRNIWRWHLTIL